MKRLLLTSFLIAIFLISGTAAAIFYARGYRIFPDGKKTLEGTGLLVATSKPDGAKVYINNHLTTATNNTINLPEGTYQVKITKDGYSTWEKSITLKKEIVSRADALLFSNAPKLESITLTEAKNPIIDDSKTLIAFTVASSSAEKNGIYVLDMNANPLISFGGSISQIANNVKDIFSNSTIEFSPDGSELVATISGSLDKTTYLLNPKSFNSNPRDITTTLFTVDNNWRRQRVEKQQKLLSIITKKDLARFVIENFNNLNFSPDHEKILYQASSSATLPIFIKPLVIGANSTPETRDLKANNTYVYDIEEDRNYLIDESSNLLFRFLSDSKHLVFASDGKINVVDFDGTNKTTVYQGPFIDNFVFPHPDGTSLIILTNLTPNSQPNLYRLILK